jgi:hypothetical protein
VGAVKSIKMAPRVVEHPGTRTTDSLEATVINQSLAPSAPPHTRELRALALVRAHGRSIERVDHDRDVYLVPSQDGLRSYRVAYGEVESCSCPDHSRRGLACVHLYALGVHLAKRRGTTARRLAALEERYDHELLDEETRLELLGETRHLRRRARS